MEYDGTSNRRIRKLTAWILVLFMVLAILPTDIFSIKAEDNVANVITNETTTGYASFKEAITAAAPGSAVSLIKDDDTEQKVEINKSLNVNLNGHNLAKTAIKIFGDAVVSITGSGAINTGHAAGFTANENWRCAASLYVTGTAQVTLNNLTIECSEDSDLDKAIFLGGKKASLTINGGSYSVPKVPGGDALFFYNDDASSLIINDGIFVGNCGLSVNSDPRSNNTLSIKKAVFEGAASALYIEGEGTINSLEMAEKFIDVTESHIEGTFSQYRIVVEHGAKPLGKTDQEKMEEAKPLAEAAVQSIIATQKATANDILKAVENSVATVDGIKTSWSNGNPTIIAAGHTTDGSLNGTIVLNVGSITEEIAVQMTISATGHNWNTSWSSNEEKHWHECSENDGGKKDETTHTWDAGKVAKPGETIFTCTVCGKTKVELVSTTNKEKLEKASKLAEEAIAKFEVKNETTSDDILKAVENSVASVEGAKVSWKLSTLTITPATSDRIGVLSGTILVTCGNETVEVSVNKIIAKQPIKASLNTDNSEKTKGAKNTPSTGDNNNFSFHLTLLFVAGIGLTGLLIKRREE